MGCADDMSLMDLEAKKGEILKALNKPGCDFLRLDRKPQVAFWAEAIDALAAEGKIITEFREVDDQYSYLRVELAG